MLPNMHEACVCLILATRGTYRDCSTVLAATDGEKAVLISRRAAKATVQYRNKRLAECRQAQSAQTKGSRQWKRLQRRKAKMLAKCHKRLCDLNILQVGRHHVLVPGRSVPNAVVWVHPIKYPGRQPGSSPGHGGNSWDGVPEALARP
jgi:hypothetical protein